MSGWCRGINTGSMLHYPIIGVYQLSSQILGLDDVSSILCSSFAMFGIILFLGGVFRLAGQRRRGGGNIRTVNFGSIFLV